MMVRAVLVDFEDVLVEFPRLSWGARDELFDAGAANVYAFLTARGCRLPSFARFANRQRRIARRMAIESRLTRREVDPRRFLRKLCHDYGLQRDDTALGTLGWLWHQPRAQTAIPRSDAVEMVRRLIGSGVRVGLIHDTPLLGRVIDQHLASLGWLGLFSARTYSSETGRPHARLLCAALEELRIPSGEAALVTQSRKMVASAHRLGLVIARLDEIPALLSPPAQSTPADNALPNQPLAHQIN